MNPLEPVIDEVLVRLPPHQRLWLGFSGGVDSHVLLHCLRHHPKLHVIHINHGLQPAAGEWAEHCSKICREYHLPCDIIPVTVDYSSGESLEAAARQARYGAFSQVLQKGDVLLTAHHSDDQIETFFLQMLRGAGPKGLSAMAEVREIERGVFHCRPCLQVSRQQLLEYAKAHDLTWIEDPSNAQVHIQRNFLRHHIIPSLVKQWPGLQRVIHRQVHLNQQTQVLLSELGAMDYESFAKMEHKNQLQCEGLSTLSEARLHNLLRYWISFNDYPMPSERRLKAINSVITAKEDAQGEVVWQQVCVRRYKNCLYLLSIEDIDHRQKRESIHWDPQLPYSLENKKQIVCEYPHLFPDGFTIHYRKGGERFHGDKSAGSHPLKKCFQDWEVPLWQRNHIPLITYKGHIIAVLPFAQAHPRIFQQIGIALPKKPWPLFRLSAIVD